MAKAIPAFTYTGSYTTSADNTYWYIYLKGNGTLKMTKAKHTVDVFLVGGGGGGANSSGTQYAAGGGGGGYTKTARNIQMTKGTGYAVTIGAGGSAGGGQGGTTSALGQSASGGYGGSGYNGGYGGSGGGGGGMPGGVGGSNGGNGGGGGAGPGGSGNGAAGIGQGSTTRAFGESTGTLYAGGGGGSSQDSMIRPQGGAGGGGTGGEAENMGQAVIGPTQGTANTGGGGGGGGGRNGASGGSGIVIIRGTTKDEIPVLSNTTSGGLLGILYNGTLIPGLIVDGVTIFMRRWSECLKQARAVS